MQIVYFNAHILNLTKKGLTTLLKLIQIFFQQMSWQFQLWLFSSIVAFMVQQVYLFYFRITQIGKRLHEVFEAFEANPFQHNNDLYSAIL